MDFKEAEALMDAGHKVARESWPVGQFGYKTAVAIKGGEIEFRLTKPGDEASTWEPTPFDRLGTDWIDLEPEMGIPAPVIDPDNPSGDN